MSNILFVHGTGVRQPSYDDTFALLKRQVSSYLPAYTLHPCYWGGTEGCRLHGGGSIPNYDTARGAESVDVEDLEMAAWQALYFDPLSEIEALLGHSEVPAEYDPYGTPAFETVSQLLEIESDQTRLWERQLGLAETWGSAKEDLLVFLRTSAEDNRSIPEVDANFRGALARALYAQSTSLKVNNDRGNFPTGSQRDELVKELIRIWGGEDRGVIGAAAKWLGERIKREALKIGSSKIARQRGALSDSAYPAAGDILLYQARGKGIRDFIEREIRKITDTTNHQPIKPLVILAHSLGGIACVDLLIEKDLPGVVKLITVGSQAPLLYELNALYSLEYGRALPQRFPGWLNFYDKYDFLSYIGNEVLTDRVKDVLVDNGQPFPESHGAYWSNPDVWTAIVRSLNER